MRRSNWLGLALVAVTISVVGPRPARASDVQGALVRPTGIIFEPDAGSAGTALRVRIQGVGAMAEPTGCYTTPACGYLYYSCKAGDEALCREQWQEIGAAASAGHCVSFGARRVNGVLANNGRLRPDGEVPAAPDVYLASEGLGVATIDCTPTLFTCAVTLTGACAPPDGGVGCCGPRGTGGAGGTGGGAAGVGGFAAGPGGTSGRGGTAGGGAGGGVAGAGGVAGGTSAGGTSTGGTSASGAGGVAGGTTVGSGRGGAAGMAPAKSGGGSGCAVAGGRLGAGGAAALAAAALALAAATARRRGRARGGR